MSEPTASEPALQRGGLLKHLFFDKAPINFAAIAFLAGCSLLITGILPGQIETGIFAEAPTILSVIGAVILMATALGLLQRIRKAYYASLLIILGVGIATYVYEPDPIRASVFMVLAALLFAARSAFFRKSDTRWFKPGRIWFLAVALATTIAVAIGAFVTSGNVETMHLGLFDKLSHPAAHTIIKTPIIAGFLVLTLAFVGSVTKLAAPDLPVPDDEDQRRVYSLLQSANEARPEAILSFLGDKRFLYSDSGQSVLSYVSTPNMLISMGSPFGQREETAELIGSFKGLADSKGVTPILYAIAPDGLPDVLEHGFKVQKIGENALLDLSDWSLSGRKREAMRRGRRKLAERHGATFELSLPPHKPELLERLAPISDAWLNEVGGKEKSFSLGAFHPHFLNYCPIGVAELNGEAVAFGTLFLTPNKAWAGIDLMRYHPEKSITNTMDFLFVELILWCQREGYNTFDLSMAPLAGLNVTDEEQGLFSRVGHFIYTRGERFYNFQGLRRFKDKFGPRWEPRYIAAPSKLSLPAGLATAARLTNNQSGATP